jgi:hypothetical protein
VQSLNDELIPTPVFVCTQEEREHFFTFPVGQPVRNEDDLIRVTLNVYETEEAYDNSNPIDLDDFHGDPDVWYDYEAGCLLDNLYTVEAEVY